MLISPDEVVERGIISNLVTPQDQIQPNGIDCTLKEDVTIPPKEFRNVELTEQFNMQDTFGLMIVRSSLSRKGIFVTSGVWDSHYEGPGGVSLYNFSNEHMRLLKGFRIGQVLVFRADHIKNLRKYEGHYQNNKNIASKHEGNVLGE